MTKFELKITNEPRERRISRTYRLKPETLILIQKAIESTTFKSATSLIEEAATQFSNFLLSDNADSPHISKESRND